MNRGKWMKRRSRKKGKQRKRKVRRTWGRKEVNSDGERRTVLNE